MNSYQKLIRKSEEREKELLADIRILIKGEWIDRKIVTAKYDLIEKMESMLWAERPYNPEADGPLYFSGFFNETNTNKDETNH